MILAGSLAGPRTLARFMAEAEAIARLRHSNVVQIHSMGDYEGHPYLELEYVEGGSLAARLNGTPWASREASRLTEVLARAIHEAHGLGIVHRDLKPANVLLAADGTPKITDFGLSKALGADPGLTNTGEIVGTPGYMAPEQAAGSGQEIGPAADVYALGAILYELLAGRPPFRAATALETLEQVRSHEPVPPRRLQPKLPRDLETICLACLSKEPGSRYASAAELADDLRRYLDRRPIRARPTGAAQRSWRWARRNPAVAVLAGTAALLMLAVLVISTIGYMITSQALAEARGERITAEGRRIEAVNQRDRARRNLEQSEANLRLAREAVDRFLNRVSESELLKAQDRSDLRLLRKQLLEEGLSFYRRLLEHKGNDPTILRGLADAYERSARILAEVGSQADRLVALRKSQEIRKDLVQARPDDDVAAIELARALRVVAAAERAVGRAGDALRTATRAIGLFEQIEREHPGLSPELAAGVRSDAAMALMTIANLRSESGDPEAALGSYRACLVTFDRLARERPRDTTVLRNRAQAQNNLGLLQKRLGMIAEAAASFRRAAELYADLIRLEPFEPRHLSETAASYNDLGELLAWSGGDPKAGLCALDRALELHRDVVRGHPSVLSYREFLARTLSNIGSIRAHTGDLDAARDSFRESLALRRELARANPSAPYLRDDLSRSLQSLGDLQSLSGDPSAAEPLLREAMAMQDDVAAANPTNLTIQEHRAWIRGSLGKVLGQTGDNAAAAQMLETAIAIARTLLERNPRLVESRNHLGTFYRDLGIVLRRAGRIADAVEAARQFGAIWPDDPSKLFDLARDLATCAAAPAAAPDVRVRLRGEALAHLRRAVSMGLRHGPGCAGPRGRALPDDHAGCLALLDLAFPDNPFD
jgi:serine/threonine-protein kinase